MIGVARSGWRESTPWSGRDLRAGASTAGVGLMMIGWSWWESAGSTELDDQTGWLVVGVLGVIVVLKALVSWLHAGWSSVRLRRGTVLVTTGSLGSTRPAVPERKRGEPMASDGFVAVLGSARYHRPDCLLVRGKPVEPLVGGRRSKADRPCEMCVTSDADDSEVGGT